MKYLFYLLVFLSPFVKLKSQTTMHKMLTLGYQYQNSSFGEVGGKLLFLNNDDMLYRLGASALVGEVGDKFTIVPKVQTDLLFNFEPQGKRDFEHSYYYIIGADFTTKYIAPKVGFNVFGIMDVTGGYAFSIDKKGINGKELKGININFSINIPIPALIR